MSEEAEDSAEIPNLDSGSERLRPVNADKLVQLNNSGERSGLMRGQHLADLREANLSGAIVSNAQLAQTASLRGAIMPDGSRHE